MSTTNRPVVGFLILTDEEVVNYAESYSETPLEVELCKRLKILIEEERDAKLEKLRPCRRY